jgi:hypothetical protein
MIDSQHSHSDTPTLAGSILSAVAADPGINTVGLCRELRVRKSDVLAELDRLRRELYFKTGHRGSKCWYSVERPASCSGRCSLGMPVPTSDVGVAESDAVA